MNFVDMTIIVQLIAMSQLVAYSAEYCKIQYAKASEGVSCMTSETTYTVGNNY